MEEKFKICDIKKIKNSKGQYMYYILVYSSLELLDKVFITEKTYNDILKNPKFSYLQENNTQLIANDIVYRSYDTFNKKFKVYIKK